jgi:iron complex outermembrane receptor protein
MRRDNRRGRVPLAPNALLISLSVLWTAFIPAVALAQEGGGEGDPWAGVEEMLVTGTGESVLGGLSETASVIEFDAEDLVAQGTQDISDLADFTPNLSIVSPSAVTATLFIRGVGLQDFSANAAGAVAVYQDGVPINSPPLQIAQMFDVRNVGILRGPQGSGNNRNASAGAIKIESRPPSLSDFSANIRLTQGSYVSEDAIDAPIQDYEGGINVPIVPDILGSRTSFRFTKERGYYTNRCGDGVDPGPQVSHCGEGPNPSFSLGNSLDEQVGDRFNWALRNQFLFTPPTDTDMEFLLGVFGSRRDQDQSYGQAVGTGPSGSDFGGSADPGLSAGPRYSGYQEQDTRRERDKLEARIAASNPDLSAPQVRVLARDRFSQNFTRARPMDINPYTGDWNRQGKITFTSIGASLRSRFDFGDFQVEATSGFVRYDSKADNDTDQLSDTLFEVVTRNRDWQVTQDLVIKGELEEFDASWEVGGYFLHEDLELNTNTLTITPVFRDASQDSWSYAAFGSFEWRFLDSFTLRGGIRYNIEKKRFEIEEQTFLGTFPISADARETETWKEPTGTIELLYELTATASVYGKYNHGFKPGHFNSNGVNCRQDPCTVREPAGKELIDAFEIGVNISSWEDRIKINAALFHYDYQDYQVFVFEDTPIGPPTLQVINANDARVLGAETEWRISPLEGFVPEAIEGLNITVRGGWLDSEFLDFQNTIGAAVGGRSSVELVTDFSGNSLPNSPRFQASGTVAWLFDIGRFGTLEPRYDFTWTDDSYFDPSEGVGPERFTDSQDLPELTLGQRAYALHNIRLNWGLPGGMTQIAGWCRNLTDERYKTYAFDVSQFRGVVINNLGDPRSCGADLSLTW